MVVSVEAFTDAIGSVLSLVSRLHLAQRAAPKSERIRIVRPLRPKWRAAAKSEYTLRARDITKGHSNMTSSQSGRYMVFVVDGSATTIASQETSRDVALGVCRALRARGQVSFVMKIDGEEALCAVGPDEPLPNA